MSRKKPLKSFAVRVRETVIVEYIVDAESEQAAREQYLDLPATDRRELETVDWEVERVTENA